jgi:hypothetical protein
MAKTFQITETMRGVHHFVDPSRGTAEDHVFYFTIDWQSSVFKALNPFGASFMTFDAKGVLFAGGLTAGEVPCQGVLKVDYIRSKTIAYELDFQIEDKSYHYVGEKVDVDLSKPLLLVKTHTTCYGRVTRDDGQIVSRSVAHFEPRTVLPFLMSFRFQR